MGEKEDYVSVKCQNDYLKHFRVSEMGCRIKSTQEETLEIFRGSERDVYAMFSNNKWMQNMYEMEYLFMYKAPRERENEGKSQKQKMNDE